jgi:hypothetical protein
MSKTLPVLPVRDRPELGRGLDVTAEHGCAVRDSRTGEWRVPPSGDFTYDGLLEALEAQA